MLHGADSDIVWLQRDFGIYVTNLFDTGQAARVLGYPSAGLAYLLSRFCKVKVMVVRPICPIWSGRCAAFYKLADCHLPKAISPVILKEVCLSQS